MGSMGFEQDIDAQLITERSLQIIAQAMLDIGNHIIAHFGWGKPDSYKEIITILSQHDIIPREYQQALEGLAGLRNILVHDYLSINPEILFKDMNSGIIAIDAFIRGIEKRFNSVNTNKEGKRTHQK